jgi:dienelactone hydrolase
MYWSAGLLPFLVQKGASRPAPPGEGFLGRAVLAPYAALIRCRAAGPPSPILGIQKSAPQEGACDRQRRAHERQVGRMYSRLYPTRAIMPLMRTERHLIVTVLIALGLAQAALAGGPRKVNFPVRGVSQTLYVFNPSTRTSGAPGIVVLSGDGGWHGFIDEVAHYFADHGYVAVGVDSKEYLSSLSKPRALEPAEVTGDVAAIARFAEDQAQTQSVVLCGWSEGAGLAVLGALDPDIRPHLLGVVAIGLPELNELAWRTSDAIIYITKKVPNEPTFNSKDYLGKVAPIPLMVIQSSRDDFVPLSAARDIFAQARDPKQIVFIDANNHRFEGQRDQFWQTLGRSLTWFQTLKAEARP